MGTGTGTWDSGTRGRGDAGTRGRGDAGTRGRGDAGTRGRGDAGTRGRGDAGTRGRGDAGTRGRGDVGRGGMGRGDVGRKDAGTRGRGTRGCGDAEILLNYILMRESLQNSKKMLVVIDPFTVRFIKLLTNGFRSSFEIPEVRYKLGHFITYRELRKEVVNFTPNFVGKLRSSLPVKFSPFGVVGLVI